MADSRFFTKSSSIALGALADLSGAQVYSRNQSDYCVDDVAPLDIAEDTHVSFLDNKKYKSDFLKTKAGACFISESMIELAPQGCRLLISSDPYKSYALAAQYFYPDVVPEPVVSEHAIIDFSAIIGDGCRIEAGAIISAGVKIGSKSWIEAGAFIAPNVEIGEHCRIGSNANVSHAVIGHHVRLYPGVCVGQDGFGFAIDPAGHVKVPQLGRVIIEDYVEIGANTTIDRGAGPDTVIGRGTWIDNLVQIGHNVKIGQGCVLVSQVGVSGSTELGNFVVLAGQVGVAGHLKIGNGARIGAQSGVMRDIEPMQEHMGSPSVPSKQYMRQVATLSRLIKNKK